MPCEHATGADPGEDRQRQCAMDEPESFGSWVSQRRRALHLTQEAVAEQLYCALGTLRKIETDERRPSQELAERLAQVLQVPEEQRSMFVKVARAELALDRLALPPDPATRLKSVNPPQPPTNLRLARSSFVGRDTERAQLHALVLRADVGLVTLTGPGGTGKTRLALEVAAGLRDEFVHGVFFVDLAPISNPALVASTIATTLGIKETPGQTISVSLMSYLRERQLLIVLDNFEQIIVGASVVADLLAAVPLLKVLVTSREVLRVYGEHEYPVQPLTLPSLARLPSLAQLNQYTAVQLFIQRAQAVRPEFQVSNENAHAVAEICARLDGLPLALELAAARVRLFAPQALLGRLEQRLKLLTGGAKNLPGRQQTLRGAIEWSHDLLDEGEQQLFRRLAVFSGGRTFESVEAVCNAAGDLQLDVLDGIESLMSKSLLRQEEGAEGEPRFVMLETIQEYARERLVESGEAEELRHGYAEYFRQVAEAAEAMRWGQQYSAALALVAAEQDNLRAALTWALDRREGETALWLAVALEVFWLACGQLSEGRQWFEAVLAVTQPAQAAVPEAVPPSAVRAKALRMAAEFARLQGDYGAARLHAEEALVVSRARGDKREIAQSLEAFATISGSEGDVAAFHEGYAEAFALHAEAIALQQELGNPLERAGMLNNEGWRAYLDGDDARALVLLEESLALRRHVGDTTWGLAVTLNSLGTVLIAHADYARAGALLTEGLRLAHRDGASSHLMWGLEGLAWLAAPEGMTRGQPVAGAKRAARLFAAAEALRETSGEVLILADRSVRERYVAFAQAHLDEAAWQAAWTEGQAMSLEQAIAYALEMGTTE